MFGRIKEFINAILYLWELIASAVGFYFTTMNVFDLWSKESRQKRSFSRRVALTLFNLLHIFAMFLAAGLFGELILSAPLATLLISATSLFSDCYEYIQEIYQNYSRQKELEILQEKCKLEHIDFQQNVLFFEDFFELQNKLAAVNFQREELCQFLTQIEDNTTQNPEHAKMLAEITEELVERCQALINENEIIHNFYQSYGKQVNPQEVIKTTNKEVQLINQHKIELHLELKRLEAKGINDSPEVTSYKNLLSVLDNNIRNLAVINLHFYMINKSQTTIKELKEQKQGLNLKYSKPPFSDYSLVEKAQLKQVEHEYITKRIESIEAHIKQMQQIESNESSKIIKFNAYEALAELKQSSDDVTLRKVLLEQIELFDQMIKMLEKDAAAKNTYLQNISSNPGQELPQDITKIFESAQRLIAIKRELALAKIEEKHKLWSTRYSIITAIIAILLCSSNFWIASQFIENIMRFVGVMAGLTCLMGYLENKRAKSKHQSEEQAEIDNIMLECRNRASMVHDPEVRSACFKELGAIANKLRQQYVSVATSGQTSVNQQPQNRTYITSPLRSSQPLRKSNSSNQSLRQSQPRFNVL
ncbi:MAG: hypothetical protein JSS07_04160 [Proteobacteria bacterium]|nr:hypothetical protein [Pseudomonadota bacterium]